MKRVTELFRDLSLLYEQRNTLYGDNYKRFGAIMLLLFPGGISLVTEDDHNRFAVFVQIVGKITRYAEQFEVGGQSDALDDTAVYAMMLRELDEIIHQAGYDDENPKDTDSEDPHL